MQKKKKKKKKKLHSLSLQKKKKNYPRRYCRVEKKKAFLQFIDFQTNYKNKDTWQYRFGSVKAC